MSYSIQDIKQELLQEAAYHKARPQEYQKGMVVPYLNDWEIRMNEQKLYILGKVKFHPQYPDGSGIKTTAILSHLTVRGRLIIMTQNSIYELGQPSTTQIQQEARGMNQLNPKYYKPLLDPWEGLSEADCEVTELTNSHP